MHYIHYTPPPFPLYLPPFTNSQIIEINKKKMAVYERRRQTHNIRYNNEPSFSSSLLDAVYRSIDETRVRNEAEDFRLHKKKPAADEDAESLRRAIMIEKWIDNHSSSATSTSSMPRHLPSNSGSSTDSSTFSSTETESSASKSTTPKKLVKLPEIKAKSKSRAQKIYGDLKKVKEPISPGGKIANFLNSIFSPRNTKATTTGGTSVAKSRSVNGKSVNFTKMSSVIKSRSVNDTKTSATRSCLSRNQFSRGSNNNNNSNSSSSSSGSGNKSKRSVRFCPVGVIVDEDSQACGHKSIYGSNDQLYSSSMSSSIGSQYIKKNIDSLRVHEAKNTTRREFYYYQKKEKDFDDMSCASSDLFELENIGRVGGSGAYEEDQLPVYGTTSFKVVAGGGIW